MDRLHVERIGGLAGYGGPHLKARGEVPVSSLSATDKRVVEDMFNARSKRSAPGEITPPGSADAFRYRITRQTESGPQAVEMPEGSVPAILKDSVRDTLE